MSPSEPTLTSRPSGGDRRFLVNIDGLRSGPRLGGVSMDVGITPGEIVIVQLASHQNRIARHRSNAHVSDRTSPAALGICRLDHRRAISLPRH